MCGLCGMLAGAARGGAEGAFFDVAGDAPARHRERGARVRLLNRIARHYGVKIADFAGTAFVVSNRTGRTELAGSVAALWPAVERLSGSRCDPFDPGLLAAIARDDEP